MEKVLKNDLLEIAFIVGDEDEHFGTRYNHLGYIKSVKLKGKNILSSPKKVFDSFNGEGFPDEFEKPIYYNEAKIGKTFVKFGVGEEKKLSNNPYTNWDLHPIKKKLNINVCGTENTISFFTEFKSEYCSYRYVKTISLTDDGFTVQHEIENIGEQEIDTMWYSHCFFSTKNEDTVILSLPNVYTEFNNYQENNKGNGIYVFQAKEYDTNGKCFNWHNATQNNTYRLQLKNYLVEAVCDKANYEFQFYINDRIASPEPKIAINIPPHEDFSFSTIYKITLF